MAVFGIVTHGDPALYERSMGIDLNLGWGVLMFVFGAVMLAGKYKSSEHVRDLDADWSKACLGSFYTKPNYPGRSSHVCNAGFLVTSAARNKGVGKQLGKQYLKWAPKLVRVCGVCCMYETRSLTNAGLHVLGVQLGV